MLRKRLVELLAVSILAVISILFWANTFYLTPVSADFAIAAQSLIQHGTLSWKNTLPYNAYPPGFPVFVLPFIMLSGDLLKGIFLAQSAAIVLFFFSAWWLLKTLKLSSAIRLIVLFIFVFYQKFNLVLTAFWSETLFMAISFALLGCLVMYLRKGGYRYWRVSLLLLMVSGFIRYSGVFNVAFFILVLIFLREKKRRYLIAVSLAVLPLTFCFIRNRLLYGSATVHIWNVPGRDSWLRPWYFFLDEIAGGRVWLLLLVAGVACMLLAATLVALRNKPARAPSFFLLLAGMITHFLGLYILSNLIVIDQLDSRLMVMPLMLALVLFFYSLDVLFGEYRYWLRFTVPLAMVVAFIAFSSTLRKVYSLEWKINYPGKDTIQALVKEGITGAQKINAEIEKKRGGNTR